MLCDEVTHRGGTFDVSVSSNEFWSTFVSTLEHKNEREFAFDMMENIIKTKHSIFPGRI